MCYIRNRRDWQIAEHLVSLLGLFVARLGRAQQVGAFGPRRASGAEIHLPSVDDKQARRHALRRRSDPLAAKSRRVMSEPAMREPYLALKVGESHRGRYRRGLPGHCQKALETIPLVRSIASSDAIGRLGAQVRQTSVFKAESLRRIAAVPRNRFNVACVRWWEPPSNPI